MRLPSFGMRTFFISIHVTTLVVVMMPMLATRVTDDDDDDEEEEDDCGFSVCAATRMQAVRPALHNEHRHWTQVCTPTTNHGSEMM